MNISLFTETTDIFNLESIVIITMSFSNNKVSINFYTNIYKLNHK